ncbi:undecaprenyl-phosphate glucose phosphotransferase [soil metagenome]
MVGANFERGFVVGLVSVLYSLTTPLVTVISLLLTMQVYDVSMRDPYRALAIISFLLAFFIFRESDVSRPRPVGAIRSETGNLIASWLLLIGILLLLGYATKYSSVYSRRALFTWFVISPPLILIAQMAMRQLRIAVMSAAGNARTVIIAGINDLSRRLAEQITLYPHLGMRFLGFFDDRGSDRTGPVDHGHALGRLSELAEYVGEHRPDVIYIALPIQHEERTKELLDELQNTTASVYFVPDIFVFDLIQARMDDIHGIPVVALCETPFVGFHGLIKRLSDIVITSVILALIAPLLLLIALGIRLTSPGPAIFKQRRYGLDGQEITVYKFRTMYVTEDEDNIPQATRDDPRVTPVGRFLRRYSLDELPQFINVLQGRMSVVGPRPHAVAHNETYRKLIKGYMVRHKVTPGITGLAQVNGLRGETNTVDAMKARVEYDLNYLRYWSLGLDFKIILKTVGAMFWDKNAY